MTSLESSITIPDEVLFREVAGEAVILNLETGKYYGLNEIGTRMWTLITEHGCLQPVYNALLEEYDVHEERLQSDLLELVDDLVARGLLMANDR
jgi:hypothetical protein